MKSYAERSEPFSVDDVTAIAETAEGLLVEIDNEEFWLPKKYISDDSEVFEKGSDGTLIIPRWLAIAKGLIDE